MKSAAMHGMAARGEGVASAVTTPVPMMAPVAVMAPAAMAGAMETRAVPPVISDRAAIAAEAVGVGRTPAAAARDCTQRKAADEAGGNCSAAVVVPPARFRRRRRRSQSPEQCERRESAHGGLLCRQDQVTHVLDPS